MAVKTMVFIDGSWMFHNKKHLVEACGAEDYDIDYKKIPLVIQDHLYDYMTLDVDIVRTHFFGSMPVNKPAFNPAKQKAFYKYLKEECLFNTEVFETDYQDDPEAKPKEKALSIALTASMMANAAGSMYDIAAFIAGDPDYVPLIKRARALGKRVLLIGLRNGSDTRLQDKTSLFDYPVLYLDDYLDKLKLERNEHYRACQSCSKEELTNWHGSDFYCSECRENDSRLKLRECNNCGKNEETTWEETYYYCYDCRESYRKQQQQQTTLL